MHEDLQSIKSVISTYFVAHFPGIIDSFWIEKKPETLDVIKPKEKYKSKDIAKNQPIITNVSFILTIYKSQDLRVTIIYILIRFHLPYFP